MNYVKEYIEAENSDLFMPMCDLINFRVTKILKIIKHFKNMRILDLGCGHGHLSKRLSDRNDVYALDVIDFSSFFKGTKVKFVKHDANKRLPFKAKFFDIVIANEVLEHLKNLNFVLDEIKRVLKDSGLLIADVPNTALNLLADTFGIFGSFKTLFYPINKKNIQSYRNKLQFRMVSAKTGRYKLSKIFYLILIFLWLMDYCRREHIHKHSFRWWTKKFKEHNFKIRKIIPCCFLPFLAVLPESIKPKIYSFERKREETLVVKYLSTTLIYLLKK